ncbi:hypothetical protein ABFS83_06G133100 [Erythranthe nasuta]
MAANNICILKITSTIFAILILSSNFMITPIKSQEFWREVSMEEMGLKTEKLSHLHFYFHDIVRGQYPTAYRVAESAITNSSATRFGFVEIIDDPLTVGPNISSKTVGRAQGMYASADLNNLGLLMVLNYVFTEGKFNGSTLSILGRNAVYSAVREMPIVGGSGVFRFARGYARASTHEINMQITGVAVVEYNVYVFHY